MLVYSLPIQVCFQQSLGIIMSVNAEVGAVTVEAPDKLYP